MIPRVEIVRWGGASADGLHDYNGWSLAIEWLGLIVEINVGKARS